MVRITATSDFHGNLPSFEPTDILLIAGDICPDGHSLLQIKWLDVVFRRWLDGVPAKHVVATLGNHDIAFERCPEMVPAGLRWHCLQHALIELEGLRIFGMPWIMPIWGAFQRDEAGLERKYSRIPDDVDIVLSHGPPHGIGDLAAHRIKDEERWPEGEHCGSPALRSRLLEIRPLLEIHGHIHEGHGIYEVEGIKFVNASLMNGSYVPTNRPFVFDVEKRERREDSEVSFVS